MITRCDQEIICLIYKIVLFARRTRGSTCCFFQRIWWDLLGSFSFLYSVFLILDMYLNRRSSSNAARIIPLLLYYTSPDENVRTLTYTLLREEKLMKSRTATTARLFSIREVSVPKMYDGSAFVFALQHHFDLGFQAGQRSF